MLALGRIRYTIHHFRLFSSQKASSYHSLSWPSIGSERARRRVTAARFICDHSDCLCRSFNKLHRSGPNECGILDINGYTSKNDHIKTGTVLGLQSPI